jgi:hypothetical protein
MFPSPPNERVEQVIFFNSPPALSPIPTIQSAGQREESHPIHHPGCPEPLVSNRKYIIMKKFIIIAAASIVATIGISYAANSLLKVEDHSKCGNGQIKCNSCNGTGFQGNFNCPMCKGSGRTCSY